MKKIITLASVFLISFSGAWSQATPNAGFENWTNHTFYDTPDNWDNPNPLTTISFTCIKATASADRHSGSTAVKLVTKNIASNIVPGVVTTGTLPTSSSNPITGGIAYTLRPDSMVGWYKYTHVSGNTGFAKFVLFGSGGNTDTIAVARFNTPASTVGSYTRFAESLVYRSTNPVVNSMWVISSSVKATAVVGSTLFVDDIALVFNPSTAVTEQESPELIVSPNPAADYISINGFAHSNLTFTLYDVTGRKMMEEKITDTSNPIRINSLSDGLYIYSLTDEKNTIVKSGKLVIEK